MGLEYKEACMQLEKAFELLTRTKVKMAYIDQNYEKIFDSGEDYQALKQYYSLETKYAALRCSQIIDSDEKLSSQRGHHSVYNKFYTSRNTIFTISFVMLPLLLVGMIYSYVKGANLIWLFGSLILICMGCLGLLYDRNAISADYYGPNGLQMKVLKRVNYDLRSGKLLEEILNDIKIQLAKKGLNEVVNTDLADTHVYPIFDEIGFRSRESATVNISNVISSNEGKTPKSKFKDREKEKHVKASVSGIADKYAEEWVENKTEKREARLAPKNKKEEVKEVKKPAKKTAKRANASDSSIAEKYAKAWDKNKAEKRETRLNPKKEAKPKVEKTKVEVKEAPAQKEEPKIEEPKVEIKKPAVKKAPAKKAVKKVNASDSGIADKYAKEWKKNKEAKRKARLAPKTNKKKVK